MVACGDADALLSGVEHALSRDDPSRAPGDRRASEGGDRERPVHAGVREARYLLRRHDGQHRSDRRAAGADRVFGRPRSCAPSASTPRIAMLSFSNFGSVQHPEAREGGATRCSFCASATRRSSSTARCRPTPRSTRRSSRATYPFSALKERANVLIFPEPERRQHRLQAAASPRRRDGDRSDPRRHAPSRARARAGRRRAGHREHGGRGRHGRAAARRPQRAEPLVATIHTEFTGLPWHTDDQAGADPDGSQRRSIAASSSRG